MEKVKECIVICLLILTIGFAISRGIKYNHLKREYDELNTFKTEQIVNLQNENLESEKTIDLYKLNIEELTKKIDSLEHLKSKIVVRDGVLVSSSITDAATTLKKNLEL